MAERGRRFVSVLVCVLVVAACTSQTEPEPGVAAPPLTVRPAVTDLETITIGEGLPEPVAVPGEPDPESRERSSGEPMSGSKGEFVVAAPADGNYLVVEEWSP